MAARLFELGCREVSLGDTHRAGHAGVGRGDAGRRCSTVAPPDRLAGHFHDTGGRALENVEVALGLGLRVFDAACGGLGGCPFAPGAAGNVATERVVARLAALGFETGIDRAGWRRRRVRPRAPAGGLSPFGGNPRWSAGAAT